MLQKVDSGSCAVTTGVVAKKELENSAYPTSRI